MALWYVKVSDGLKNGAPNDRTTRLEHPPSPCRVPALHDMTTTQTDLHYPRVGSKIIHTIYTTTQLSPVAVNPGLYQQCFVVFITLRVHVFFFRKTVCPSR